MRVQKGFNLIPTVRNLAPHRHRHEKIKHYKMNDGTRRLHQTKPKDVFNSQFHSLF